MSRLIFLFALSCVFFGCQTKNSITALMPVTKGQVAKIEAEQKAFDAKQSEAIEELAEIVDEIEMTPKSANLHLDAHHQAETAKERADIASQDNKSYQQGPDLSFITALLSGDPTAIINIVLALLGITGVGYGAAKRRKADRLRTKGDQLARLSPKKAKKLKQIDPDFM